MRFCFLKYDLISLLIILIIICIKLTITETINPIITIIASRKNIGSSIPKIPYIALWRKTNIIKNSKSTNDVHHESKISFIILNHFNNKYNQLI